MVRSMLTVMMSTGHRQKAHMKTSIIITALFALSLTACGGGSGSVGGSSQGANATAGGGTGSGGGGTGTPGGGSNIDMTCDNATYPSQEWTQCEQANYARTTEAPAEVFNPAFFQQYQAQGALNQLDFNARTLADPSWMDPRSGNTPVTPLCTTWNQQCVGDPFRYPTAPGPNGQAFYDNEAEVSPFVFYDQGCARISGRVWRPRNGTPPFPAVVIENGSVQAPETIYWWAAQALIRAGYVVMTFDPRGQGRSDQQTPDGTQGSNANPVVFWEGLVNAIDFFRATPGQLYPHNTTCAGTYPTPVVDFNPYHAIIDRDRLGIAGHSLGGTGVSVVQSYGATGADPWPGLIDTSNPVDAVVAWDGISTGTNIFPHKPILGHNSEYGLTPRPFDSPPDPNNGINAFRLWQAAGIPVIEQTVQGSTHYEWSLIPTFPTTSWCPTPEDDQCTDGWGQSFGEHYTVAWFDRWLKQPGETGFATADTRLLDDDGVNGRNKYSFRFLSARDFPDRLGNRQLCEDIRAGC